MKSQLLWGFRWPFLIYSDKKHPIAAFSQVIICNLSIRILLLQLDHYLYRNNWWEGIRKFKSQLQSLVDQSLSQLLSNHTKVSITTLVDIKPLSWAHNPSRTLNLPWTRFHSSFYTCRFAVYKKSSIYTHSYIPPLHSFNTLQSAYVRCFSNLQLMSDRSSWSSFP